MSLDSDSNNPLEELKNELFTVIFNYQTKCDYYYNMEQLVDNVLENLESYKLEKKNRCLMCGDDLGPQNPRQLCGKTCCYNT
mgnify:CR=1 FL=1|tara:strand:+ start:378 stop:623 length:246 start_codon:yes stop_codon:yes gene_type:complete